jgi:hypothetical protein
VSNTNSTSTSTATSQVDGTSAQTPLLPRTGCDPWALLSLGLWLLSCGALLINYGEARTALKNELQPRGIS